MTKTAAQFRADFPEFEDSGVYSDGSISFWLNLAYGTTAQPIGLLPPQRWAERLDVGAELFVAHNIVLEKQAMDAAASGGAPGISQGPIGSKSVGPVSIGYNTQAALELDAGHWNLTVYGTRFVWLAKIAGAGPLQEPGGCGPPGTGGAWAGPPLWPGWYWNT